jgi:S-adenosylmethionine hydrolase
MKAVILGICRDAQIVDISHEITKFDVRMGAFVLASAVPYFPKGTVHVAVVDPGVGTKRRPIVVETKHSLLVGPDNGLLMPVAEREGVKHVYAISNANFTLEKVSKTFHGRDVFAPVAAYLAKGHSPSEMGSEINNYVVPDFATPKVEAKALTGQVLHIDDFGNIITNISAKDLNKVKAKEGAFLHVELNRKTLRLPYGSAYGEVKIKELLAVVGGHGFLEISINQGNAAKRLGAKPRMGVRVSRA